MISVLFLFLSSPSVIKIHFEPKLIFKLSLFFFFENHSLRKCALARLAQALQKRL